MNISHKLQNTPIFEQEIHTSDWTAGPLISSHKRKGFDHTGLEMKVVDMELHILEVFPPTEVAKHMKQPAPDVIHHLEDEGLDISHLHRRFVSFVAYVSMPLNAEDSGIEITLQSGQCLNGGVYKQKTYIPQHMICIRESAVDTVVDSLNKALHEHNWYPPY